MKIIIKKKDDGYLPLENEILILWSAHRTGEKVISMPLLVEQNSEELKKLYLKRIKIISTTLLDEKEVYDYFNIKNNLNFWNISSLMQKFNSEEGSEILDVIKVIALNKYVLINNNKNLISIDDKSISKLIIGNNNKFNKIYVIYKKYYFIIESLLYYFIKIIGMYLYFKINNIQKQNINGETIFFDVLAHLEFENNSYSFGYWGKLENKINEWDLKVIWMHSYLKNKDMSFKKALYIINNHKNIKNLKFNNHFLTDTFINIKVILLTLKLFIKIVFLSNKFIDKVYKSPEKFDKIFTNNQLLPLIKSLYSKKALDYCYRYSLFEEVFSKLKNPKKIFFLYENQPWESALISVANKNKNIIKYGVAHSTIRPWDLRYYEIDIRDNRSYPDKLLVNSEYARKLLMNFGYSKNKIILVEALRYMYINKIRKNYRKNNEIYYVIVYCDYLKNTTIKIIDWIKKFQKENKISSAFIFSYKEHPAYINIINDRVNTVKLNTENTMINNDIAITSSLSTTAIESFEVGLKVLQILDFDTFDFSLDLDNKFELNKASSYDEFIYFFENIYNKKNHFYGNINYFEKSSHLKRWKKILDV